MDIQSAIHFVVGSILFSVGFLIIGALLIALNNMFSKYWKPVKWNIYSPQDYTVIDHETIEELKRTLSKQKDTRKEFIDK
jgi:hypothetical protein